MMIGFNMRVHVHIGEAPRPRVLADGGRVGRASERGVNVETYSAMGWFCTRQTSSRFGRWNWMSAPG